MTPELLEAAKQAGAALAIIEMAVIIVLWRDLSSYHNKYEELLILSLKTSEQTTTALRELKDGLDIYEKLATLVGKISNGGRNVA